MEQDSSFNDHLRKEITARALIKKKIKIFKENIDENNKKKLIMLIKKLIELKKLYVKEKRKINNFKIFI